MQNSQTVTEPWHRRCSRCGKQCFIDLLDSEGLCDYCREVRAMKTGATKSTKKNKVAK
jgi:hypothetical protein